MKKNDEGCVYLWHNTLRNMYYLGKHVGSPDDLYAHSSTKMESFKMDNVPPYFRRRIIFTGTAEEVKKEESRLLRRLSARPEKWDKYYNEHKGYSFNKKKKEIVNTEKITVTKEEFDKMLEAIDASNMRNKKKARMLLLLMYYTGIGFTEIVKLKINHVIDNNGEIKDSFILKDPKLPFYVPEALKDEIKNYLNDLYPLNIYDTDSYFIPSQKGGAYTINGLENLASWCCRVCGYDSIISFRRTYVMDLINAGLAPNIIMKLGRFKNWDTLKLYYTEEQCPLKVINSIDRGNLVY